MSMMNTKNKIKIVPAILKGVAGTIFIFAVLTVLSYQNRLPVDGKLTMGFPCSFYSSGTGYNPELDEYASFENFERLKLLGNILFAVVVYMLLRLLLRALFAKKKS